MLWALLALVVVAAAALFWGILTYNGLVRRKNLVQEGWSVVETHLKQRANLIPNLVETVKGYMGHERETLEKVTALRGEAMADGGPAERAPTERRISSLLGQLRVAVEAYPELKASEGFLNLQGQLDDIEASIQISRRYYNGTVRDLNTMIESFPSNVIASWFGFKQASFFEIEDSSDRAVPSVAFN